MRRDRLTSQGLFSTEGPTTRRRKTVLRTLRIPEETANAIDVVADEDGTTFNAVVSSIANEYVVWTRNARKYGFVVISKRLFRLTLDCCDDEKVEKDASKGLADILRDEMIFLYQSKSPDSLMRLFADLSKHGSIVTASHRVDGMSYALTLHHEAGPRFSLMLRMALDELIRREFRAQPSFEEGGTSLIARFSISQN